MVALLFSSACGGGREAPPPTTNTSTQLPNDVFVTLRSLTLEENADVINVAPAVHVNRDGSGFFIVDTREARARLYNVDGSLAHQFGSRGQGPGEFRSPLAGYRWDAETLVVADMGNGLVQFSGPGIVRRTSRLPLQPLYGALPLSRTTALIMGRLPAEPGQSPNLLHLWDLDSDSLVTSFFPMPGDSIQNLAGRNFGWVGAAVRGDTIAAVFALTDTVYLFDTQGSRIGRIPLDIPGFRPMTELPGADADDPVRLEQWLSNYLFVNHVFALSDGTFVIQYERPGEQESRWSLLRIDSNGRTLFHSRDTPRLFATAGDELIFQSPDSLTPNRWDIVKFR